MARLLVLAVSATHTDPVIDAEECFKKGDIISIQDDGHVWGNKEQLPTFVHVDCPDVTKDQILAYRDAWERHIQYEIISQNAPQDGARIRIYTESPGGGNEYGLTREQVETWLENWGGVVRSIAVNEVVFDISIEGIYTSAGFWDADPAVHGITITEQDYDQTTGRHRAEVNAINSDLTPQNVVNRIARVNGTIIEINGDIVIFDIYRNDVRARFMGELKDALLKKCRQRRFYFASADVDNVVAGGGQITLTQAQLTNNVLDKTA